MRRIGVRWEWMKRRRSIHRCCCSSSSNRLSFLIEVIGTRYIKKIPRRCCSQTVDRVREWRRSLHFLFSSRIVEFSHLSSLAAFGEFWLLFHSLSSCSSSPIRWSDVMWLDAMMWWCSSACNKHRHHRHSPIIVIMTIQTKLFQILNSFKRLPSK